MDSFWDFLWLIIISFAFIAYLILLFSIITDLFRDHKTSGWVKAIWIVFLFFIPLLTSLVAGDVFAAAYFLKASERTSSALEAGRFANAVAGLSLREVGVSSVPTRQEIERALREG